ncbi:MAG: nucleotidyltransferase family protein [Gemmatimonadota bacterium]
MTPTIENLKQTITPLLREYGVVRAGVFGSRARGDARPDSDLDLLVELEHGRSLFDLTGLELDLTELLGYRAHVVTYKSLHRLLRDRILTEQVALL